MGGKIHLFPVGKLLHFGLILAMMAGFIYVPGPVQAAQAGTIITVNSTADSLANDGFCTLREAIIAANNNARSGSKAKECSAGSNVGIDRIVLPNNLPEPPNIPPGTFVLTRVDNGNEDSNSTGDLDILGSLIIESSGPGVTIVGTPGDRLFQVLSGDVVIRQLTIKGGYHKGDGGGIYNAARLSLVGVTLANNQASGGGGGGIYNATRATLTVFNSTISGNTADRDGGGLLNLGTATLNNVTITANVADANADGSGDGGGIATRGGTLAVSNTIIAGNNDKSPGTKQSDCSSSLVPGSLKSGGYSLIQSPAGCSGTTTTDLTGVDPMLGPLQNNGGNTLTHALLAGSPAIDAGNPAVPGSVIGACEVIDQRLTTRPHGKACDIGAFEAFVPPVLIRAFSDASTTTVVGRLDGAPNTPFNLQLFSGTSSLCNATGTITPVGSPVPVTTDPSGDVIFRSTIQGSVPLNQYVIATATDPGGFASSYSSCIRVGPGNDSWPGALELFPQASSVGPATADDFIDLRGQSRWYKFKVEPGSRVIVTLTNLPANYDLTLYKDIAASFNAIKSPQDLVKLGAEFAPDAFAPDAFAPDAFAPDAFAPDAFAPDAFAPDAFAPDAFAPDAFAPDAFAPDAFAPDAFAPDAFAPDAFAPDAFAPDAFAPDAFAPDAFAPDAFASAQTRSLIAISAFDGLVSEGIRINTWDNNGYFYVRVRGRNGAFNPQASFHLEIRQNTGDCPQVSAATLPSSNLAINGKNYKTVILTNPGRMEGTSQDKDLLAQALQTFAARPEIAGAVVDVSQDARVAKAYSLFDQYATCPVAANLVAGAIKGIVDGYRAANPSLEYAVVVGNDYVIPFFRHPDHSMLASEQNYSPPVKDNTSSQASLKLGYVLSQDDYGAVTSISLKDDQLPIPSLAVGRLVETPSDALAVLNAYSSTSNGVVATPTSAMVTGYDFLANVANEVDGELAAGLGTNGTIDTLIAPRDQAPTNANAWTADDLRAMLLGKRHDLIFLAGHFSADSALAADYTTRLMAAEVAASSVDLTNSVIYSAGCHAGYNIVNPHDVPNVTREPDWAQAIARKGATLIAGTGYQYGDTDFVKYSEQLYQLFTQQLRTGDGPVPVGKALVAAKQAYLSENPYLRGIDEKSLLEATVFGLPMLSVNLPGARITPTPRPSVVSALSSYTTNPGVSLGLQFADITLTPVVTQTTVPLESIHDATIKTAMYLSGPDGVVAKPNEPVLPLENVNVSSPGTVLRGVGFREGDFTDMRDIFALTGASATEVRGVHMPFLTNVFYPAKPWTVNYFDALADQANGITQLAATPAQYVSNSPSSITGTLRSFGRMKFRLFYSSNTQTYPGTGISSTPALAAAPSIVQVASSVDNGSVTFHMRVVGNPAAGIQEVWVTYTEVSLNANGQWRSVDLKQNPVDSTLWEGTLSAASTDNIRYIVQAANGVGLVSMDTNQGAFYIPGAEAGPTMPTSLNFVTPMPTSARYSTPVTLSAKLTANGSALPDQIVAFVLGPQSRLATTGSDGVATVTISAFGLPCESENTPTSGLPCDSEVRASFAGAGSYQASYDTEPFKIEKQGTLITLDPQPAEGYPQQPSVVTATLTDVDGRRLGEETLFFVISGNAGSYNEALITDYAGRARLGNIPLPPGSYQLSVYFSGNIPPLGLSLSDDRYLPYSISVPLTLLNHPPDVSKAKPSIDNLWPPNNEFYTVSILGVTDPDGDPVTIAITSVFQDEPVGSRPDAIIQGSTVQLRAERDGNGDGRVYHIRFIATDGRGGSSTGEVLLGVVPHDQSSSLPPVDGGALYDSTVASK